MSEPVGDPAVEYWRADLQHLAQQIALRAEYDRVEIESELRRAIAKGKEDPLFARYRPPASLSPASIEAAVMEVVDRVTTPLLGRRASEIEPEEIRWLWPGRIPSGTLTTIDGDPGLGKSTLTIDFAARVSAGTPWPDGGLCEAGGVVLLSAEDNPASTIVPRLAAAHADLDKVHCVPAMIEGSDGPRPLTIPDDLALIEDAILKRGTRLVVIDPLNAFLSGRVDTYRDQDVRRCLAALASLAECTKVATLIIRHLNKRGDSNPMYRGAGSIGLIAAARAGFMVGPDPDDAEGNRRVFAPVKCNLAVFPPSLLFRLVQDQADPVAHVEWLGETTVTALELVREPERDGRQRGSNLVPCATPRRRTQTGQTG